MRYVFDASAALAILFGEARGVAMSPLLSESCIGTVNLSEVVAVMVRRGGEPGAVRESVEALGLPLFPLSPSVAITAGLLWSATKSAGSSLGDRCALALTRELGATLLTTDRRLAQIAPELGVDVRLVQPPGAGSAR